MIEGLLEKIIRKEQLNIKKTSGKALIIDDSESYHKVIKAFIGMHAPKCEIKDAYCPFSALKILKQGYVPDLITVDFKLPDLDGVKLAQNIYKINKSLPLIILTSCNVKGVTKYARKAPDHNIKRVIYKGEINNYAQWMVDKYINKKSHLFSIQKFVKKR